jgi:hypothetical protein
VTGFGRDYPFADVAESCRSEPPRERWTTAVGMRGELAVPANTGQSPTTAFGSSAGCTLRQELAIGGASVNEDPAARRSGNHSSALSLASSADRHAAYALNTSQSPH